MVSLIFFWIINVIFLLNFTISILVKLFEFRPGIFLFSEIGLIFLHFVFIISLKGMPINEKLILIFISPLYILMIHYSAHHKYIKTNNLRLIMLKKQLYTVLIATNMALYTSISFIPYNSYLINYVEFPFLNKLLNVIPIFLISVITDLIVNYPNKKN